MKRVQALTMQEVMSDGKNHSRAYKIPVEGKLSKACQRGDTKNGCTHCTMLTCSCKCHKRKL